MFSKSFRFNLVQLVFNYIFRLENELSHDVDDVLLLTTADEEKQVLIKIIDNFTAYQNRIIPYLQNYGWAKTPILSRTILISFLGEMSVSKIDDQSKIIAEYLHLTQDLAGADSVSLVHAVIGKIVKELDVKTDVKSF